MSALPKPDFIERDPGKVTREMIAQYEAMAEKTLYPAQVERLLVDLVAYRESLLREAANDAALQNLVDFSRAPVLDYLGQRMTTPRLPAQPARARMRVTFAAPIETAFRIEAGVRVETTGGVRFVSEAPLEVAVGDETTEFPVVAEKPGVDANGYLAGEVSVLVDELPAPVASVSNIAVTHGGMAAERDEPYRARIKLAPEKFSWGSEGRYRSLAMETAPEITDARVVSPRPDGTLRVILFGREGAPSTETVARVLETLTDKKNRMLGDRIEVVSAIAVEYAVRGTLDVLASHIPERVLRIARERCQAFVDDLSLHLGRDIVPEVMKTSLHDIDGLYDIHLESPARRVLAANEWAKCAGITLTLGRVVTDD